ncbi:hypothetical protein DY218_28710 [Streptomyces triticagri]|uniref:Uncharacterized protein n=1 Tax=Streptomyces triticagri TaxID=2293568 RepID=A0A372LXI0_9ACTN|nr:hypothetical protein DY218_28710 [Streptomyces triticagri]
MDSSPSPNSRWTASSPPVPTKAIVKRSAVPFSTRTPTSVFSSPRLDTYLYSDGVATPQPCGTGGEHEARSVLVHDAVPVNF